MQKSAKKYGENKNSVYWKTKGRKGEKWKARKRKKKEEESVKLLAG